MNAKTPPLALTMGEPGGIGPEITEAAWSALRSRGPAFFVIGDPDLYRNVTTKTVSNTEEAARAFADALPVLPLDGPVHAEFGVASPGTANAVIGSIAQAVKCALSGAASGVVTNPINKSALTSGGFTFPGHTEFLDALTADAPMRDDAPRGAIMMLAGPELRTVPVTIHQSVVDAAASLRPDLIVHAAVIVAHALRYDFGVVSPRIAISGLNPHAGEDGAMGMEDAMIIAPAVDEVKAMGVDVTGPLPADTMFHPEARAQYDAALCMLHDQALIPAKTLAFHDAVNVTLGLPIIRTSPDHGTALNIAGKGAARADSLIAAIRLAGEIAARRAS